MNSNFPYVESLLMKPLADPSLPRPRVCSIRAGFHALSLLNQTCLHEHLVDNYLTYLIMGTSHKLCFARTCTSSRYMCMQFPSFDPLASSAHEASFRSIHEHADLHTWLPWIPSCAATCFQLSCHARVASGPLVCETSFALTCLHNQ